jgi:hypothetical protein
VSAVGFRIYLSRPFQWRGSSCSEIYLAGAVLARAVGTVKNAPKRLVCPFDARPITGRPPYLGICRDDIFHHVVARYRGRVVMQISLKVLDAVRVRTRFVLLEGSRLGKIGKPWWPR